MTSMTLGHCVKLGDEISSPLDLRRAELVALRGLDVVERELPLQLLLPALRARRPGDRHRRLGQRLHVAARLKKETKEDLPYYW